MAVDGYHVPVLLNEIRDLFEGVEKGTMIDGTIGGGGHGAALLEAFPHLRLIGLDRDPDALKQAASRLAPFDGRFTLIQTGFEDMGRVALTHAPQGVVAILLDLGVSSRQIDNASRGFSFSADGPLDMRMNPAAPESASHLVNTASEERLTRIFFDYGEERRSRRIAATIIKARQEEPIQSTRSLVRVIERAVGPDIKTKARIFQALRIEVNFEMESLDAVLDVAPTLLRSGGRLAVIAYHSLEDRRVKRTFKALTERVDRGSRLLPGEVPPPPPSYQLLTKKALVPTEAEIVANSRARSAKLRGLERL